MKRILLPILVIGLIAISCTAQSATNLPPQELRPTPDSQIQATETRTASDVIPKAPVGTGNIALSYRVGFLLAAIEAWTMNHGKIDGLVTMEDISSKGFLPFWIIDPVNGEPIQILRETAPHLTQVAYWPIADKGWDMSIVAGPLVTDPNATPDRVDAADWMSSSWSGIRDTWLADPAISPTISSDDWDVMIWAFKQTSDMIMECYLMDHGTVPSSFHDMLDGHYFINDDFLARAASLVAQGAGRDFEMGVIRNKGKVFFYCNFTRKNGVRTESAWYYRFGPNGYDITDMTRQISTKTPQAGERIVFVTESTLAYPDSWLSKSDRKSLSAFFSPG